MTHVDLEDRAPVLVDHLAPHCEPSLLAEVADRVCEALEKLGQEQEDPARRRD